MINLFALISSSPKLLKTHHEPVGPLNNFMIKRHLNYWSNSLKCDLWLGWGNNGSIFNRDLYIKNIINNHILIKNRNFYNLSKPLIIGMTNLKNPIHPLYCKDKSLLFQMN